MVTRLGQYLETHGLTHEEFAAKAQVPAPQVSLWSRAIRRPGIENAMKIAAATDNEIPVEYWATVHAPPRRKKRPTKRVA